jgi:hypothetical protein
MRRFFLKFYRKSQVLWKEKRVRTPVNRFRHLTIHSAVDESQKSSLVFLMPVFEICTISLLVMLKY